MNEFSRSSNFEERNNPRITGRFDRRRKEKEESNVNRSSPKDDKIKRKVVKDNRDSHPYKSSQIDGFLKFIQEIGDHILTTKYFWKRLPYSLCSEEINVETNGSAVCWNGNSMGK